MKSIVARDILKPAFPRLYESRPIGNEGTMIVYFVSLTRGIVIHSDLPDNPVGDGFDAETNGLEEWKPCTDTSTWTPFMGNVTLRN